MFVAWLRFRRIKNAMLADVVWALGISALAWFHVCSQTQVTGLQLFELSLVSVWALRLSGYLYWTRLYRKIVDPRYQTLVDKNQSMLINYQFQGALQNIIALPWLFLSPEFHLLNGLGIGLFIFGLSIECLADYQLYSFKQRKTPGVCEQGLWQYSRHPNYFGECLIWIGFACMSSSLWAWISPLSLYAIMRWLTGPITEAQSLQSKAKLYQSYQERVPMIFPKFW
jgi:steroid 5-alpha reductase family enzyme